MNMEHWWNGNGAETGTLGGNPSIRATFSTTNPT